jgi:hypothetical protein
MDDIEKQHLDEARDPLPERVALNPDRIFSCACHSIAVKSSHTGAVT